MAQTLVMPGQVLSEDVLPVPHKSSMPLKLGPGLRHAPPSTITTSLAGPLCIDRKKNAIWVENNSGRVRTERCGRWTVANHLAPAVHSPNQRCHHRYCPSLLHRLVSLLDHTLHHLCSAPSTRIRRCHEEDPAAADFWWSHLRSGRCRFKAFRP